MFSTSLAGANLYSLVMTYRANDLNPCYNFRHVFTELAKRSPSEDMSDLLPWNVEFGEAK